MPIHHLARLCTHLAISGASAAARSSRNRELVQPGIVIHQTNQPYPPPYPGEGYLPGYQPFTNQPTSVNIGQPQPIIQPGSVRPDSYLVLAILATIFCFFPFGIPAIVYASQVDSAYATGDFDKARSSSGAARGWTIAACLAGVTSYCLGGFCFYLIFNRSYSEY